MDTKSMNISALAYLGDSVYEILVRKYLVDNNNCKANKMQKEALNYVSAKSQAKILDDLINRQIFTDNELYTIKRARNYTPNSKPKYTDIVTYKKATALETLFGELYLNNKQNRIKEIFNNIVGE